MNNLFDNTEKFVKCNRKQCDAPQIRSVLNPASQAFISEQQARDLGIIFNGYYRNGYGGLIPLNIAANKGLVQFTTDDKIQIEYHSRQSPVQSILTIHEVYDSTRQCMIPCRQAIEKGYVNLQTFSYLSMTIHDAFYRGLITGELLTKVTEPKSIIHVNEKSDVEYDNVFSSLTNIINCLSEFRNAIHISDQCELTSQGFIREKKTGKEYLLTQAIELGFVSIKDISSKSQCKQSTNDSTLVDETVSTTSMNDTRDDHELMPYFSDTFIFDLLKVANDPLDEYDTCERFQTAAKQFLSPLNTC
ncbi:unnamed protein product [Adineta ricciae]|uniref:Uncharacterized protein n=1 Tax=Adineta ricciae TaxID=249248 RepID=A0A814IZX5_ADIRI|nr:unnamed protein product [Adineta ricciae]CAF1284866.1 unnamed protein product [Adineta ricciae]